MLIFIFKLLKVKRDSANNSKGFGFVRFKDYNHQCSVLGKKHFIDGRWCDVKIPNSQVKFFIDTKIYSGGTLLFFILNHIFT